jgi:hypothetical protein
MANGKTLSITTKRISVIEVETDSKTVASYGLDYDPTPGSNASRLKKIRRYGADAPVGDGGTINHELGVDLDPKETLFTYADYAGFGNAVNIDGLKGMGGLFELDVNSDGVAELLEAHDLGNNNEDACIYRLFSRKSNGDFAQLDVVPQQVVLG